MSLWTPGGEHPVERGGSGGAATPEPGTTDAPRLTAEQEAEAQQIAAEMQQVRDQLASVPAAVVIANHAMGCYELAAIHLSAQPPRLDESRLAIDAFAALVGTLKGRLGADESTLEDALAQIRLAYVQISGTGGPEPDAPETAEPEGPVDDANLSDG